jgi:hypothetical protein
VPVVRFVLLFVLGGCIPDLCYCDDGTPTPYVTFEESQINLGDPIDVQTAWLGTCGTPDKPVSCNEQTYSVAISCEGATCTSALVDQGRGTADYQVTPGVPTSPPIRVTVTLKNKVTGEVFTDTEAIVVDF